MRSASLPPRRPPRSVPVNSSAQFVLPFLGEPMMPGAEPHQNQHPSSQSQLPEKPPDKAVPSAGSATKETARKPLRPASARRTDRALPASARSQPIHKPVIRSNTRPVSAGIDSLAVSPNIVVLIESRAEAWSARELAKLIGCTGKHNLRDGKERTDATPEDRWHGSLRSGDHSGVAQTALHCGLAAEWNDM